MSDHRTPEAEHTDPAEGHGYSHGDTDHHMDDEHSRQSGGRGEVVRGSRDGHRSIPDGEGYGHGTGLCIRLCEDYSRAEAWEHGGRSHLSDRGRCAGGGHAGQGPCWDPFLVGHSSGLLLAI